MSTVALVGTKFTTLHNGDESYGFRIYSDTGEKEYSNVLSESEATNDDASLFRVALQLCDDTGREMLHQCVQDGETLEINGHEYSSEELNHMI